MKPAQTDATCIHAFAALLEYREIKFVSYEDIKMKRIIGPHCLVYLFVFIKVK